MKISSPRLKRGMTLIELTVAMGIGMMMGSILLALFNQQLAFLKIFKAQNFLTDEAPIVNMYVSKLVGRSDRFRLHDSVADALSGTNPRLTPSPVVLLNFRQPDGSAKAAILSFEALGTGRPALYYYVVPAAGILGAPQWAVSKSPSNVSFAMVQGVLRMTLEGPNGDQITYSGTMQQ